MVLLCPHLLLNIRIKKELGMCDEYFFEGSDYVEEEEAERQMEEEYNLNKWIKRIKARKIGLGKIPRSDWNPEIVAECVRANHGAIVAIKRADHHMLYDYEDYIARVFDASSVGKKVSVDQLISMIGLHPKYANKIDGDLININFVSQALAFNPTCALHFNREVVAEAYRAGLGSPLFKKISLEEATRRHFRPPCDSQES